MSAVGASVRVLVADDDGLLRDIAAATLEAAGFIVETVPTGDAALAACARHMPDIVLLDVEMPDGDGYQACSNIRTLPGGFDVPIVMVTGLDDPTSINLAYDAGATDFVLAREVELANQGGVLRPLDAIAGDRPGIGRAHGCVAALPRTGARSRSRSPPGRRRIQRVRFDAA